MINQARSPVISQLAAFEQNLTSAKIAIAPLVAGLQPAEITGSMQVRY